ncbi:unnamed protein product [Amoebophrya sp. A120]|nr:unnamed protein product [Amoebophrya sp. A120]|eukprot:GSA120T00006028001.1
MESLAEDFRHTSLQKIVNEPEQSRKYWEVLQKFPDLIAFFLTFTLKHARDKYHFSKQLVANPWDLAGDRFRKIENVFLEDREDGPLLQAEVPATYLVADNHVAGFSGTSTNAKFLLPLPLKAENLPQLEHTNGRIISVLKQKEEDFNLAALTGALTGTLAEHFRLSSPRYSSVPGSDHDAGSNSGEDDFSTPRSSRSSSPSTSSGYHSSGTSTSSRGLLSGSALPTHLQAFQIHSNTESSRASSRSSGGSARRRASPSRTMLKIFSTASSDATSTSENNLPSSAHSLHASTALKLAQLATAFPELRAIMDSAGLFAGVPNREVARLIAEKFFSVEGADFYGEPQCVLFKDTEVVSTSLSPATVDGGFSSAGLRAPSKTSRTSTFLHQQTNYLNDWAVYDHRQHTINRFDREGAGAEQSSASEFYHLYKENSDTVPCFVYFDDRNNRGADWQLPANAVGAVLFNEMSTFDQVAQASWRLRQLELGQSLRFAAWTTSTHQEQRDAGATTRGLSSLQSVDDLIQFLLEKSAVENERQLILYAHQAETHLHIGDDPDFALLEESSSVRSMYGNSRKSIALNEFVEASFRRKFFGDENVHVVEQEPKATTAQGPGVRRDVGGPATPSSSISWMARMWKKKSSRHYVALRDEILQKIQKYGTNVATTTTTIPASTTSRPHCSASEHEQAAFISAANASCAGALTATITVETDHTAETTTEQEVDQDVNMSVQMFVNQHRHSPRYPFPEVGNELKPFVEKDWSFELVRLNAAPAGRPTLEKSRTTRTSTLGSTLLLQEAERVLAIFEDKMRQARDEASPSSTGTRPSAARIVTSPKTNSSPSSRPIVRQGLTLPKLVPLRELLQAKRAEINRPKLNSADSDSNAEESDGRDPAVVPSEETEQKLLYEQLLKTKTLARVFVTENFANVFDVSSGNNAYGSRSSRGPSLASRLFRRSPAGSTSSDEDSDYTNAARSILRRPQNALWLPDDETTILLSDREAALVQEQLFEEDATRTAELDEDRIADFAAFWGKKLKVTVVAPNVEVAGFDALLPRELQEVDCKLDVNRNSAKEMKAVNGEVVDADHHVGGSRTSSSVGALFASMMSPFSWATTSEADSAASDSFESCEAKLMFLEKQFLAAQTVRQTRNNVATQKSGAAALVNIKLQAVPTRSIADERDLVETRLTSSFTSFKNAKDFLQKVSNRAAFEDDNAFKTRIASFYSWLRSSSEEKQITEMSSGTASGTSDGAGTLRRAISAASSSGSRFDTASAFWNTHFAAISWRETDPDADAGTEEEETVAAKEGKPPSTTSGWFSWGSSRGAHGSSGKNSATPSGKTKNPWHHCVRKKFVDPTVANSSSYWALRSWSRTSLFGAGDAAEPPAEEEFEALEGFAKQFLFGLPTTRGGPKVGSGCAAFAEQIHAKMFLNKQNDNDPTEQDAMSKPSDGEDLTQDEPKKKLMLNGNKPCLGSTDPELCARTRISVKLEFDGRVIPGAVYLHNLRPDQVVQAVYKNWVADESDLKSSVDERIYTPEFLDKILTTSTTEDEVDWQRDRSLYRRSGSSGGPAPTSSTTMSSEGKIFLVNLTLAQRSLRTNLKGARSGSGVEIMSLMSASSEASSEEKATEERESIAGSGRAGRTGGSLFLPNRGTTSTRTGQGTNALVQSRPAAKTVVPKWLREFCMKGKHHCPQPLQSGPASSQYQTSSFVRELEVLRPRAAVRISTTATPEVGGHGTCAVQKNFLPGPNKGEHFYLGLGSEEHEPTKLLPPPAVVRAVLAIVK